MTLDPNRLEAALSSLLGAAVYGLFRFAVLLRTGQPVTVRDIVAVVTNVACAILAGVLLAFVFSVGLMALIPWPSLRDPWVIGFGLGAFGWELLPLAYRTASGWAERRSARLTRDEGQ